MHPYSITLKFGTDKQYIQRQIYIPMNLKNVQEAINNNIIILLIIAFLSIADS